MTISRTQATVRKFTSGGPTFNVDALPRFTNDDLVVSVYLSTGTSAGKTVVLTERTDYTLDNVFPSTGTAVVSLLPVDTLIDGTAAITGGVLQTNAVLQVTFNPNPLQSAALREGSRTTPLAIEKSLDRNTMAIKSINRELDRAIKLGPQFDDEVTGQVEGEFSTTGESVVVLNTVDEENKKLVLVHRDEFRGDVGEHASREVALYNIVDTGSTPTTFDTIKSNITVSYDLNAPNDIAFPTIPPVLIGVWRSDLARYLAEEDASRDVKPGTTTRYTLQESVNEGRKVVWIVKNTVHLDQAGRDAPITARIDNEVWSGPLKFSQGPQGLAGRDGTDGRDGTNADPAVTDALSARIDLNSTAAQNNAEAIGRNFDLLEPEIMRLSTTKLDVSVFTIRLYRITESGPVPALVTFGANAPFERMYVAPQLGPTNTLLTSLEGIFHSVFIPVRETTLVESINNPSHHIQAIDVEFHATRTTTHSDTSFIGGLSCTPVNWSNKSFRITDIEEIKVPSSTFIRETIVNPAVNIHNQDVNAHSAIRSRITALENAPSGGGGGGASASLNVLEVNDGVTVFDSIDTVPSRMYVVVQTDVDFHRPLQVKVQGAASGVDIRIGNSRTDGISQGVPSTLRFDLRVLREPRVEYTAIRDAASSNRGTVYFEITGARTSGGTAEVLANFTIQVGRTLEQTFGTNNLTDILTRGLPLFMLNILEKAIPFVSKGYRSVALLGGIGRSSVTMTTDIPDAEWAEYLKAEYLYIYISRTNTAVRNVDQGVLNAAIQFRIPVAHKNPTNGNLERTSFAYQRQGNVNTATFVFLVTKRGISWGGSGGINTPPPNVLLAAVAYIPTYSFALPTPTRSDVNNIFPSSTPISRATSGAVIQNTFGLPLNDAPTYGNAIIYTNPTRTGELAPSGDVMEFIDVPISGETNTRARILAYRFLKDCTLDSPATIAVRLSGSPFVNIVFHWVIESTGIQSFGIKPPAFGWEFVRADGTDNAVSGSRDSFIPRGTILVVTCDTVIGSFTKFTFQLNATESIQIPGLTAPPA